MDLTEAAAGAFIALSAALWAVTSPLWGPLSQAFGRKPFILLGLVAFILSTASLAFVSAAGLAGTLTGAGLFWALMAGRALYGAFGSAGPPASQAYVADRTSAQERTVAVAKLTAAFGAGSIGGPAILNAASVFGWWGPFAAVAALAALCALGVLLILPERTPPRSERRSPRPIAPWRPDVRGASIVGLAVAAALAANFATVSFHFLDRTALDADAAEIAVRWAWAAAGAMGLLAQLVITPRLNRPAIDLIMLGAALMGVGQALLLFAPGGVWGLACGFAAAGFGYGFARPGFMAAASLAVAAEEQGAVAGMSASVSGVAFITGPLLGSLLYEWSWAAPPVFNLGLVALALLTVTLDAPLRATRGKERQPSPTPLATAS